ncbi:MAG TPA: SRPBCC family protein [Polyangiaceae bacterium]|jgi:ribosome-associated toxin RatA of RatAB toxin-antitoxin module|nr:SRPBCC family protein [Polyangiaceae bacterium]
MKYSKASGSAGFLASLRHSRLSGLAVLGGLLLSQVSAAAAPASGPELQKWREVSRFNVKTPYADINAGAARVNVDAPQDLVRSVVLDFKNYAKFMARFEKSQIVGRSGDKTDVYLQVPILKGAAKVWAVVRFEPIKQVDGTDVLVGHMVKGNVKRLDATWRLKKLDDSSTQVALELLIVPDLPVPDSLVVPEVRFAAAKAVEGSRDEAEKRKAR